MNPAIARAAAVAALFALGDVGLLVLTTKHLIGLYQGEGTTLLTNSTPLMDGHRYKVNKQFLPKEGTPVKIVMQVAK